MASTGRMICFLLIITGLIPIAEGLSCPLGTPKYVPSNYSEPSANKFAAAEAGLQIFKNYRIECDGFLSEWRYLTLLKTFTPVTFAIFRMRPASPANNPIWDIVGKTKLATPPADFITGEWITVWVQPIDVKTGDYLGIYYESWKVLKDQVLIPEKVDITLPNADTYVYLADASTIKNDVVNGPFQIKYRIPALGAVINSFMPTDEPPTEEPVTTEEPTSTSTTASTTTTRASTTSKATTKVILTTTATFERTTMPTTTLAAIFTTEIDDLLRAVWPDFVKRAGFFPDNYPVKFTPISYIKAGTSAGTRYEVKIRVLNNSYVHLSIWKPGPPLAGLYPPPQLLGFTLYKEAKDELEIANKNNDDKLSTDGVKERLTPDHLPTNRTIAMAKGVWKEFRRYNPTILTKVFILIYQRRLVINRRIIFGKVQIDAKSYIHIKMERPPGSTSPEDTLLIGFQLQKSFRDPITFF